MVPGRNTKIHGLPHAVRHTAKVVWSPERTVLDGRFVGVATGLGFPLPLYELYAVSTKHLYRA